MRQQWPLILIYIVVLGAGFWGYQVFFQEELSEAQQVLDVEVVENGLTVLEVEGDVTFQAQEGNASSLTVGERIQEGERVRVGADSRALLGVGEGNQLVVEADSSIQIRGISSEGILVELEGGRVKAVVEPGNPAIEVAKGERSVRTQDGAFAMSYSETEGVLASAADGTVELTGFGEQRTLARGHYIHAAPGRPIVSADQAKALLLRIDWPDEEARRSKGLSLAGETLPNLPVSIRIGEQETEALADEDGRFVVDLELAEGNNRVEVVARDPVGNTVDSQNDIRVDTTAPMLQKVSVPWAP